MTRIPALADSFLAWLIGRNEAFLFPEGSGLSYEPADGTARVHAADGSLSARLSFGCNWPMPHQSCVKSEEISVRLHKEVREDARSNADLNAALLVLEARLRALESRLPELAAPLFPRRPDGLIDWPRSPFYASAQGKPAAARDAYLKLANVPCDLACAFCTRSLISSEIKPPELYLLGLLYDFALRMQPGGGHRLEVGGDEPMNHPDMLSMLALASDLGWRLHLHTSAADKLDKETIGHLARFKVRPLHMPIYGATAATHDAIVGLPGHHAQTMHALREARKAGLPVKLSTIVIRQNLGELVEMDRLASIYAFKDGGSRLGLGLPRFEGPSRLLYEELLPPLSAIPTRFAARVARRIPCLKMGKILSFSEQHEEMEVEEWGVGLSLNVNDDLDGQWAPVCEGCRARARCEGPPLRYVDLYGDREFGLKRNVILGFLANLLGKN